MQSLVHAKNPGRTPRRGVGRRSEPTKEIRQPPYKLVRLPRKSKKTLHLIAHSAVHSDSSAQFCQARVLKFINGKKISSFLCCRRRSAVTWERTHDLSAIRSTVRHAERRRVELSTGVVVVIGSRHVVRGREIGHARHLISRPVYAGPRTLPERSRLISVGKDVSEAALVRVLRCMHVAVVRAWGCGRDGRRCFQLVVGCHSRLERW